MKKTTALLVLTMIFVVLMLPAQITYGLVDDEFVIEAYDWSNYDGTLTLVLNNYIGYAQPFSADETGYLANATFAMYKVGSPQGYINCSLQGFAGGSMNGTVFDTSETEVYSYDLGTSVENVTFNFEDIDFEIDSGSYYAITLQWINTTNVDNSANYVRIWRDDNSGGGMEEDTHRLDDSPLAWSSMTNYDMIFEISGFETEGGPEEEDSGTSNPIDLGESVNTFVSVAVPTGIILLPLGLWIWLSDDKNPGKWIVLILLTVGIGLGVLYAQLPTWLIVLLAVGLVGLAYQDIRHGG